MVLSPKAHWAFGDTACLGDTVAGKEVSLNFKNGIPEVLQQKMGAEPSQSLEQPGASLFSAYSLSPDAM